MLIELLLVMGGQVEGREAKAVKKKASKILKTIKKLLKQMI